MCPNDNRVPGKAQKSVVIMIARHIRDHITHLKGNSRVLKG